MTSSQSYKRKVKALRPFVKLDVDLRKQLTPGQKGTITKYYNEYLRLHGERAGTTKVYRPRKRINLKTAQKTFGQTSGKWKVAFVPGAPDAKIKFKKRGKERILSIREFGAYQEYIRLDQKALAADPEGYINSLVARHPGKVWKISAGMYQVRRPFLPSGPYGVGATVAAYVHKYTGDSDNWENWLHSLSFFEPKDQRPVAERDQSIRDQRAQRKKDNRKSRRIEASISKKEQKRLLTESRQEIKRQRDEIRRLREQQEFATIVPFKVKRRL